MSLYGTGRREGIVAALCITAMVLLVHLGASELAAPGLDAPELGTALRRGVLPALGGLLCYRLLRAQGRSRYAGFLIGAAYGLSPWFGALGDAPREQLAAALAPLALEMACRCDRPLQRRIWCRRHGRVRPANIGSEQDRRRKAFWSWFSVRVTLPAEAKGPK